MKCEHWIFCTTPDTDFNNLTRSNFQLFDPAKSLKLSEVLENISIPILLIDHDRWEYLGNTVDKLTELFTLVIQAANQFFKIDQVLIDSSIDPADYRRLSERLSVVSQELNFGKIILLGGFNNIKQQHSAVVPGSVWYFRAYNLITYENNGVIDMPDNVEREFSCLNRTPKDHRLLFYSILKERDLLSSFVYSFHDCWTYLPGNPSLRDTPPPPAVIIPEESDQWRKAVDNIVDFPITWLDRETGINDHGITHPAYHKAYCNIVTETSMTREFISEKIWKPIAAGQLFLVVGSQHTCRFLEDLGFYTFEKELYDDEPDHVKRIQKVVNIVSNKRGNVRQWWLDNLDKIQYNQDRFYSKEFNDLMITSITKHFPSTK